MPATDMKRSGMEVVTLIEVIGRMPATKQALPASSLGLLMKVLFLASKICECKSLGQKRGHERKIDYSI